jgi:hypothetical protein
MASFSRPRERGRLAGGKMDARSRAYGAVRPGPFVAISPELINRLPKWAREYLHYVSTFAGAEEVQEIFHLRDQNRALIKLVGGVESRESANGEAACESGIR